MLKNKMYGKMDIARFRMSDGMHTGYVVKENPRTMWVIPLATEAPFIRHVMPTTMDPIKRHKVKHVARITAHAKERG